jgi:hypothetical protein
MLAGRLDPTAERFATQDVHAAPYIEGSARSFGVQGKATIMLWLTMGSGSASYADPAACGAERLAQLHRDYPDPDSRLRQKAEAFLATWTDVVPGLETLWVMLKVPGHNAITGGSFAVDAKTLAGGAVPWSSSGGYTGFALPATVRVTADGRGYHRSVRPVRRFYLLRPARGTGPIVIRERAADGHVLTTHTVRG